MHIISITAPPVTSAHDCPGCSTCGGSGTLAGGRTCTTCGSTGRCSHGGGHR